MDKRGLITRVPAQWALRALEYISAALFGFIILERCNLGGTGPVLEWVKSHNELFLAGVAALICVYGLIRAFFYRPVIPFAIYGSIVNLIGTVNYYKLLYRSEPAIPFDVFNMGPAFTIAGKLGLGMEPGLIFNLLFFALCLLFAWLIPRRFYRYPGKENPFREPRTRHKTPAARRFWTGLPVFCLSALCLAYMASVPRLTALGAVDIRYDQYNNYMKNGFMAATLLNFTDSGVKAPKGYGAGMMAELRERIIAEPEPPAMGQPPKKPHIIVLQMEAYGDPGFIDPRVAYREDPFGPLAPYEGELQRFRTLTSVLGGGTANTEYEFLTGYNTYFCPPGAIPFIRYLHGPKPSLAADLAELGYSSVVMHPHKGSFYSRTSAYGRLGFDRFVTQEEFDDPVYIGHYISDGSFGRKVLEIYEEEKGQGPLFLYGISIQNHGPYSNPDHHRRYALALGEGLALSGVQIMELETYGANLRDASAMLAELIRYFSAQSEPILLLVYGDHQAAWSWVHGLPAGADLDMRRYSSEGFFWANYPLEDDGRPLISVSGLGPRMMRKAGLPLPLYQKGIDLQFREVLAYNVAVTVENDGSVRYITPEGAGAFQPLQYDRMFGKNYLEQRD